MTDFDEDFSEEPAQKKKSKPAKKRTSRSYRHERCGGVTRVEDEDYSRLANPFTFVWGGTYCAECEADISLEDLCWQDTNESIADYRRRVRATAPLSMKLTGWVAVPIVSFSFGAGVGLVLIGGLIGFWGMGILSLVVFTAFSMPTLCHFIWGIDFRQRK